MNEMCFQLLVIKFPNLRRIVQHFTVSALHSFRNYLVQLCSNYSDPVSASLHPVNCHINVNVRREIAENTFFFRTLNPLLLIAAGAFMAICVSSYAEFQNHPFYGGLTFECLGSMHYVSIPIKKMH